MSGFTAGAADREMAVPSWIHESTCQKGVGINSF